MSCARSPGGPGRPDRIARSGRGYGAVLAVRPGRAGPAEPGSRGPSTSRRSRSFGGDRLPLSQDLAERLVPVEEPDPHRLEQIVLAYEVHLHRQDAEQQVRVGLVRLHQGGPRIDCVMSKQFIVPKAERSERHWVGECWDGWQGYISVCGPTRSKRATSTTQLKGAALRFEQRLGVEMPAWFYCEATFTVPGRQAFVLCGQIVDGTVKRGMRVTIPLPDGGVLIRPIDSIEHISTTVKRGAVGLLIHCESQGEAEAFQRIGIRDVQCSLAD